MDTVITYDISSKHQEFKRTMLQLDYTGRFVHDNGLMYLLNITLCHQSKTSAQTRDDAQNMSSTLNIKLEQCISTQFEPDWARIVGEPFNE